MGAYMNRFCDKPKHNLSKVRLTSKYTYILSTPLARRWGEGICQT